MRLLIFFVIFVSSYAVEINPKFANPQNCQGCHAPQYNDWKDTWHSKAHEKNNPLFRSVVAQVRRSERQTTADVLTHCAKCHNPKLTINKVNEEYKYAKAFQIDTETTQKVDSALVAKHTQTGISCFICHNIEKLDPKPSPLSGGLDIVHWTSGEKIVGPFEGNNRPGFHTSEQKEYFMKGNDLCLTCHQGSGNYNNLPGYQTGEEISKVSNAKRCVDCHMSEPKPGYIAPNLVRNPNEPAIKRGLRDHVFAGPRTQEILSTTLDYAIENKGNEVIVAIKNNTPHKAPTGFSGRSINIEINFYDQNNKLLETQEHFFKTKYTDKRGKESLSYTATKLVSDNRLKPLETRKLSHKIPAQAKSIKITSWFYLVDPSIQKMLDFKDKYFNEKKFISSRTFVLR